MCTICRFWGLYSALGAMDARVLRLIDALTAKVHTMLSTLMSTICGGLEKRKVNNEAYAMTGRSAM